MKYSPVRDASGRPTISPKDAAIGCWGFGVCVLLLGWNEWRNPTTPPFTGRFAWLFSFSTEQLGPMGPSIAWFSLAALFLIFGLLAWTGAKKTAH
jgi:hypothetical protein